MIGKMIKFNPVRQAEYVIINLMSFRPFLFNLVLLLSITSTLAGPAPPHIPQIICSAFCSPKGCNGYTANNCNNNCNVAWGWIPLGSVCALLSDWALLDTSSDSGGSLDISPPTNTSNCPTLTSKLGGKQPFGDFKANQTVTITKYSGTALAHYAIDLIFDLILIDTNQMWSTLQWNSCQLVAMLGPNTTKTFPLSSSSPLTSQDSFCGSSSDLQKNYQVQLNFPHNITNSDIVFSLTTNNVNPNAVWIAKEFIVTLRLCHVACTSCYSSSAINTCFACDTSLGYKLGNTTCLSRCSLGFGYTTDPGKCVWCDPKCATCFQKANNCSKCVQKGTYASSLVFDKAQNYLTCTPICPNGSVSSNGQCIKIWGCVGVFFYGEAQKCLRCDTTLKLALFNNTCTCMFGYLFDSSQICHQICGDGRLFELQCDDGNTVDGDGCSSTCKLETLFKCYNGSKDHQSDCVYMGKLKVSQAVSSKVDGLNQALITLDISPKLGISSQKDFIESLNFSCNAQIDLLSWHIEDSKLILQVKYSENLQGKDAGVQIRLNSTLVRLNVIKYQFTIKSRGPKILYNGNYQSVAKYGFFFQIMALSVLLIFVLSSFSHKMIGVETINAFQFIYFMCLLDKNSTELYFSIRYLTYTNLNFLFYQNKSNNYFQIEQNLPYISQNEFLTKSAIAAALCFPLFLPILKIIANKWISEKKKTQFLDRMRKFTYCCIWFPLSAGFLLVMTAMNRHTDPYMNFILLIFMSLIFFYEWRFFFMKRPTNCYADVEKVNRQYVAVYLTFSFLMVIAVHLANMGVLNYPVEVAAFLTVSFLLWFAVCRPYKDTIHNVGQLMNLLMLLGFLIWSLLRTYMLETFTEDSNQISVIMVICLLMILSLTLSIIRFIYEVRAICRRKNAPKESQEQSYQNRIPTSFPRDKSNIIVEEFQRYNRYCVDIMNLQRRVLDQNQFNISRAINDVFLIQKSQLIGQLNNRIHKRFKIEDIKPKGDQNQSLLKQRQRTIETEDK